MWAPIDRNLASFIDVLGAIGVIELPRFIGINDHFPNKDWELIIQLNSTSNL